MSVNVTVYGQKPCAPPKFTVGDVATVPVKSPATTVTFMLALTFRAVAVIVAVPGATAVITALRPLPATVATFVSLDVHVTAEALSTTLFAPSFCVTVALTVWVDDGVPSVRVIVPWESSTVYVGSGEVDPPPQAGRIANATTVRSRRTFIFDSDFHQATGNQNVRLAGNRVKLPTPAAATQRSRDSLAR
jgi:hypothetical protein